ncbi:hypothetical protein BJX96DRAFT_32945 [Aspergillus floccosus]
MSYPRQDSPSACRMKCTVILPRDRSRSARWHQIHLHTLQTTPPKSPSTSHTVAAQLRADYISLFARIQPPLRPRPARQLTVITQSTRTSEQHSVQVLAALAHNIPPRTSCLSRGRVPRRAQGLIALPQVESQPHIRANPTSDASKKTSLTRLGTPMDLSPIQRAVCLRRAGIGCFRGSGCFTDKVRRS